MKRKLGTKKKKNFYPFAQFLLLLSKKEIGATTIKEKRASTMHGVPIPLIPLFFFRNCFAFVPHLELAVTKCRIGRLTNPSISIVNRCEPCFVPEASRLCATISSETLETEDTRTESKDKPNVVLVAGFESFNRNLYYQAARELDISLSVFSDSDIRSTISPDPEDMGTNPTFEEAVKNADAFIGSLVFDYDDTLVLKKLLPFVKGPRLIFESATELMEFNRVGSFSMKPKEGESQGPPPAVKAILSKFSSGREEDKLSAYIKLLKVGPSLLKFVPGEKAGDLRTWLEAYRYWNQGGKNNVMSMMKMISDRCRGFTSTELPTLEVTPDLGIIHPLRYELMTGNSRYFESPADYMHWRLSSTVQRLARDRNFTLAPPDAPRVAVLLYRKHVITEQRYILDLIRMMESDGLIPVPIFINGVEAHTIVRDLLTSGPEMRKISIGLTRREKTFQPQKACLVDAIVNTVGFPLVGGPAGSMEAGRNVAVAEKLLSDLNVPYFVASPLLLQSIPQWKENGVLGLQSVVLYSLPELDGAIDTVILGGLVGDKIALIPERVRKLNHRVLAWVNLRRTPTADRKIAIALYGFPLVLVLLGLLHYWMSLAPLIIFFNGCTQKVMILGNGQRTSALLDKVWSQLWPHYAKALSSPWGLLVWKML